MSWVTNLLLHIGLADRDRIDDVNAFFSDSPGLPLVSLDDPALPKGWYGGSKYLEARLYVGAFNHLDLGAFLDHLRQIAWRQPEVVQVIVMEQEDTRFRIIDVFPEDARQNPAL